MPNVVRGMRAPMPSRFPRFFQALCSVVFCLSPTGQAAAQVHPLESFFERLDRMAGQPEEDNKSRIAWWGDSAIISDGYTGQLRKRLQQRFGDGGPGFLLTEATFKGHVHRRVRIYPKGWRSRGVLFGGRNARFGYGGVSSLGYSGANTTYVSRNGPFDGTVTVFFESGPKTGLISVFFEKRGAPFTHNTRLGDNGDTSPWRISLPKMTSRVRLRSAGGGPVRVYGVAIEQKAAGVVLDTLGVLGLRGRRLLKNRRDHHVKQIAARAPHLLVSSFGGNERVDGMGQKKHFDDMVKLMTRLKLGAPKASCMFFGPLPHGVRRRGKVVSDPRLKHIIGAQRLAAAQLGCAFVDPSEFFGSDPDDVIQRWRADKWIGGDLAHLTNTGHRMVGDAVAGWFMGEYDRWKASRVVPPPSD